MPALPKDTPEWSMGQPKSQSQQDKRPLYEVPGPGQYDPSHPDTRWRHEQNFHQSNFRLSEKVQISQEKLREKMKQKEAALKEARERTKADFTTPGPQYTILGDFDFVDPNNKDDLDQVGRKKAKFCFGIKKDIRNKDQDRPGPGEYEVDQYPMNQKNISYWMGTDHRRDLAKHKSGLYPGPGYYYPEEQHVAPAIKFPQEKKNTVIEKTNEPGPGTYATFTSIGVMPAYQRNNANARQVTVAVRNTDEDEYV